MCHHITWTHLYVFIIGEFQYNHNLGVIKLINIQEIGLKTLIMLHCKQLHVQLGAMLIHKFLVMIVQQF
jgi:hypothetical protein